MLTRELTGKLLGDKGYIGQKLVEFVNALKTGTSRRLSVRVFRRSEPLLQKAGPLVAFGLRHFSGRRSAGNPQEIHRQSGRKSDVTPWSVVPFLATECRPLNGAPGIFGGYSVPATGPEHR